MSQARSRVLVVDDEDVVREALVRVLSRAGHEVTGVGDVAAALDHVDRVDAIVSDLNLPGASGIDLLRAIRERDRNLPVVFLTGMPDLKSAMKAVELGAFRYLTKPISNEELRTVIDEAVQARALARAPAGFGDRIVLEQSFRSALDSAWMAFQPLVSSKDRTLVGYEALLRSLEPALPTPIAMIDAAEKLGALHMLGQRLRRRIAIAIDDAISGPTFFVNVHVADLADADLYDPKAPLSRHADRVVLEITERASLEGVRSLKDRIRELRALGYRVAVDDLGAGYAGLSYFASVQPEVMKLDMSLVRGVDTDPIKQRVIQSLTTLAQTLAIDVVAEGIETPAERDMAVQLGCTHLQGYAFARPGPPFPAFEW